MKKLFVSILALAAFAACQSNFEDVTANTPGLGDNTLAEGLVRIYAEVGIGDAETKATYGSDLSAQWEENDQIALLQESANYNAPFSTVNKLKIKSGAGTNCAMFNGEISVPTESPRRYHIAYPADAVSFETNVIVSKSGETTYAYNDGSYQCGYWYGTANFTYTYNSTLKITVPASQNGKWEPYMYVSTEGAVSSNGIGAKTLNTLTGAIAVRAFESDGKTPMQLRSIAVTASTPIAGAFSGTAVSAGTMSVTGDPTPTEYSVVSPGDIVWYEGYIKGKAKAEELLISKSQTSIPTSVTPTSELSLAFNGDIYTVGAENMDIVADNDGNYTYCLNVAPFKDATLTIMATAMDGSTLIRTIDKSWSLEAGHRAGFIFTWEDMGLSSGTVETWYDSYENDHNCALAKSAIYVNDISVKGVSADQVTAVGVRVYDAEGNIYKETAEAGVLSLPQVVVSDVESGTYTVCAYAKVSVGGEEKELLGSVVKRNVTSEPVDASIIQSSYSKNGNAEPTNSIGGRELQITPKFSDANIPANLVASCKVTYGSTTVDASINTKKSVSLALGQYNCYVKFELTNGYICESANCATYITGIPYTMNVSANDSWNAWSTSGSVSWGSYVKLSDGVGAASMTKSFGVPADTSVSVECSASAGFGYKNTNFSITVSGSKIFDESGKSGAFNSSGKDLNCNETATMSANGSITLANSYGLGNTHSRVHSLKINYNY
uniref:hypothetical protein n=1 Tax=Alistipes sp. TaxID=1872444 RepID=UPI0040563950